MWCMGTRALHEFYFGALHTVEMFRVCAMYLNNRNKKSFKENIHKKERKEDGSYHGYYRFSFISDPIKSSKKR